MIERHFSDLSDLKYRIFTIERNKRHRLNLTILEWTGTYGYGSQGNYDGVFMRVVTYAALSAWHSHGVIFDLRGLEYEWGDKILEMFGRGLDPSGVEDMPYATLISEKCRPGFSTCMSIVEPVFDTLESAVEDVARRALENPYALRGELEDG